MSRLDVRVAVLLALLGAAAVVVLSVLTGSGLSDVDSPVLRFALDHRSPGATTFFDTVTKLGGTIAATVVVTAVAGFAALRRWWVLAGQAVVTGLGAVVLVVGLKRLFDRQRPPLDTRLNVLHSLSFPSGHALGSMVAAYLVVVLVVTCTRSVLLRTVAGIGAALYLALIGASRLYLAVHWTTDVLGGWLIGAAWATLCLLVAGWVRTSRPSAAVIGAAASGARP
ncbi:phosphatase PAP2 family protein [Rhodococcus sp. X156]|uniref:phosphatase PAP2 family protein n=1 Tax=Rhodococcus sp. X156 TaxID=2499145 RepID=UPI000FD92D9E|nr:phosphatase PAP2 family protein [Rhodococcus sp. X156]